MKDSCIIAVKRILEPKKKRGTKKDRPLCVSVSLLLS
jgi:hypothetical protein